jgi:CubicO group peptidase (beta-lactamase class C family)
MTDVDLKKIDFGPVEEMMTGAIESRVFPGAVLLVQHENELLFQRAFGITSVHSKTPVTADTVFDLASLTKPLATSLAVMLLIQEGKLTLDQPIGDILPTLQGAAKDRIEIRHLLLHTSGLPAHRSYFKQLLSLPYGNCRERINSFLAAEPLVSRIGEKSVYSDIGFMMLRWVVETVSGMRLDRFVQEKIYRSLGISPLYFLPEDADRSGKVFAATQWCPWRKKILEGIVGDENAFVAEGVDGHAGLFGTAKAVGDLLAELMALYHGQPGRGVLQPQWVKRFLARDEKSGRTLGFDMPTPGASSSGKHFSEETVGHLGFTGTSFWVDLRAKISIVLLTNRVHPSVENEMIRDFRPEIHDTVMAAVL